MSSGMSEEERKERHILYKKYWLWTMGGRTLADILVDIHGEYVSMLGYQGLEDRVYIPRYERLVEIYRNRVVEQTEALMDFHREKENPSLEE